jgi:hypothetical protein
MNRTAGANTLDQAPYRFEGSHPAGGDNPTPLSPPPVQSGLRPTALPQGFLGIQQPDPNNLYDRLRYSEGILMTTSSPSISSTHLATDLTAQLLQQVLALQHDPRPPPPPPPPPPQPSTSERVEKPEKRVKKGAKSPIQGHHPKPRPTSELTPIPKPHCKDHTSLDLAMGLGNRYKNYIQIRVRRFHSTVPLSLTSVSMICLGSCSENLPHQRDRLVKILDKGSITRQGYALRDGACVSFA